MTAITYWTPSRVASAVPVPRPPTRTPTWRLSTSRRAHVMRRAQPSPVDYLPILAKDRIGNWELNIPLDNAALLGLRGRRQYLDNEITTAFQNRIAHIDGGYDPDGLANATTSAKASNLSRYSASVTPAMSQAFSYFSVATRQNAHRLLESARANLVANRGLPGPRQQTYPWSDLPAVLLTLLLVGEYDLVIEIGTKVTRGRDALNARRDLYLAVALGHVGLADEVLEDPRKVPLGCARLEEALSNLRSGAGRIHADEPLAPELAADVEDRLATLIPQCVLEQLADPINAETAEARRQTCRVLAVLLAHPEDAPRDDTGASVVTRQFVKVALSRCTSEELQGMAEWYDLAQGKQRQAPRWMYDGCLVRVCRSLIVAGFQWGLPDMIVEADKFAQMCHWQGGPMLAERAVCRVLLGDASGALSLLRRAERMGHRADRGPAARSDPIPPSEVMAFIRAESSSSSSSSVTVGWGAGDALPGLCAWVETWLESSKGDFRDLNDRRVTLEEYFDHPDVAAYLTTATHGRPIAAARQALRQARAVVAEIMGTLPGKEKKEVVETSDDEAWGYQEEVEMMETETTSRTENTGTETKTEAGVGVEMEGRDDQGAYAVGTSLLAGWGTSPGGRSSGSGSRAPGHIPGKEANGHEKGSSTTPPPTPPPPTATLAVRPMTRARVENRSVNYAYPPLAERVASIAEVRRRARSVWATGAVVATTAGVIFAGAMAATWAGVTGGLDRARLESTGATTTTASTMRSPKSPTSPRNGTLVGRTGRKGRGLSVVTFSTGEKAARALVQRWQGVKKQAMGKGGRAGLLSEYLDGEYAETWASRWATNRAAGWYWEYVQRNCVVLGSQREHGRVRTESGGEVWGTWWVDVEMDEQGTLRDARGNEVQTYDDVYRVRYTVEEREGGRCVIVHGCVLP